MMDETIECEEQPGEIWDPPCTPNDDREISLYTGSEHEICDNYQCVYSLEKLQFYEEEQELLNSSLFALTTHFAQVQFRLKQIVDAPIHDKEELLKSLEEFAFRGIPDVGHVRARMDDASFAEALRLKRAQQEQLIEKLKTQLSELERYAFESGGAVVPQDVVLERQRAILNELKIRMNLDVDEQKFYQLTPADVKQQVDVALGQLVNPFRMKEHLVAQLQTQVADLERFIDYLQADTKKRTTKCACGCAIHSLKKSYKTDTAGIVQRTAMLLQMFVMMHLGCSAQPFKKNNLKNTMKVNHWGDLRARLEMAIAKVAELVKRCEADKLVLGDYNIDSESPSIVWNVKVTTAVRQYLANGIRDLIQHGAIAENQTYSIVPFSGCLPWRFRESETPIHAWEIILQYYHFKNGDIFNSTPARKLSRSFNLDIAGASPVSNKQSLLSTIGNIISTHTVYKRSYDSQFKAFVCAALNSNKLVRWLSLIFQCRSLLNMHYRPWSYAVKTGFTDALQSLDILTDFKFNLPVDLAIQQFQNIKDVFT